MKQFFSKLFSPYLVYSSHIFKFLVNQVTMSALGFFVFVAYLLVKDIFILRLLLAIFPVGFFCFLLYDAMFEFGHKDSVSIQYKKIKFDKLFGAKIFAFGYLPTLIIIVLDLLFCLLGNNDAAGVTLIIYYILNAFNLGVFGIAGTVLPAYITMILMCIPPLFFCTLGYYLGAKDLPIRKIFGLPVKPYSEREDKSK